jgi:hypothetical protein
MSSTRTFTLTLADTGDGDPKIRLRRLLKLAGRYLGFQCIDVISGPHRKEASTSTSPTPPPPHTPHEHEDEMNIASAFPSNYIKSAEISGDVVVTITKVAVENVGTGRDAERKPVVYFQECDKGLVLNKVNSTTISDLYGPETDRWAGQRITLFVTQVDYQGKPVAAIRIRVARPAPAAPPVDGAVKAAKHTAWMKFVATTVGMTAEQRSANFRDAAVGYLPKPPQTWTASDWLNFAADGFVSKQPASPISDTPTFSEAEIPF